MERTQIKQPSLYKLSSYEQHFVVSVEGKERKETTKKRGKKSVQSLYLSYSPQE